MSHYQPSKGKLTFSNLLCLSHLYLIYQLVLRNLKLRFRKSYLGIFWTLLIPLATALVYGVVFTQFLKVKIPNYLLFLLSGLLPWSFFSSSLTSSMECLLANQPVLNKVPLAPYAFVLAETLTAFTYFLLSLPVLIFITLYFQMPFNPLQLLIPLVLVLLALITWSMGLILAYSFVYLRDLRHLMVIVFQLWFYLTPILYEQKMVPPSYQFIMWINPVAGIFDFMHSSILSTSEVHWEYLAMSFLWFLALMWIALKIVRTLNQQIVEGL